MHLFYLFLIIEGIAVKLCQPHKLTYAPSGGLLNISCLISSDSLNGTRMFYWFRRTWRDPEKLKHVTICRQGDFSEKYNCKQEDTGPVLEIHNISIQDSGVYYCAFFQKNDVMFGNATALITGDNPRSNSPVVLLAPLLLPPSNIMQLACAVNVSCNITQWTWNVSGVCHKGKIICMEDHDGNWTCVNLISLSSHSWSYRDNVICEVWCNSSPIKVQWRIPEIGTRGYGICLRFSLTATFMVLSICCICLSHRCK
ncbi:uncharacterized protein [Aquarana catesbeiana]|uniref:uncharacterized protein n=1 Tax=Aquarana catesbeiana TaxID=8400 RepID=UPI003CC93F20